MLYAYEAYGLRIASALQLPGLASRTDDDVDVTIISGSIPAPDPKAEPEGQGCWRADTGEAAYHWDGVGSLLVQNGRRITYEAETGAGETAVRLAVMGPGMATILHQRGLLVLHASAVLTKSGVVAFVGPSGRGKSTTASSILDQGRELFTDDLLAVSLEDHVCPLALPGPPQVKLWPQTAEALGHAPDALPRLGAGYTKRVRHVSRDRPLQPAPLRRLYLLHEGMHPEIAPLSSPDALMQLMTHSYCSEVLRFCGERQNFLQCAELLRHVPSKALVRGGSLNQLCSMANAILQDLES